MKLGEKLIIKMIWSQSYFVVSGVANDLPYGSLSNSSHIELSSGICLSLSVTLFSFSACRCLSRAFAFVVFDSTSTSSRILDSLSPMSSDRSRFRSFGFFSSFFSFTFFGGSSVPPDKKSNNDGSFFSSFFSSFLGDSCLVKRCRSPTVRSLAVGPGLFLPVGVFRPVKSAFVDVVGVFLPCGPCK